MSAVVRKDFPQEMGLELDPAESRVDLKTTYRLNTYQVPSLSWKTTLSIGTQDDGDLDPAPGNSYYSKGYRELNKIKARVPWALSYVSNIA